MTEPTEKPAENVVVALTRVIRDLPGIGKDQKASQQQGGYAYRGIEQITRVLQPLLARHGVVFAPHRVEVLPWRDLTINGKPWTDERTVAIYRVYGPGGPGDFIEVSAAGIGRDNADKGANKCASQMFKYVLLQTLCISDPGDDADGTTHEADHKPEPASDEDRDDLGTRIEALDDDHKALLKAEWTAKIGQPLGRLTADRVDAARELIAQIEALAAAKPDPNTGPGTEPFTKEK